jgi:hypothetical protein
MPSKDLNRICYKRGEREGEKENVYKGGSLRRQSIHASSSLFFKVWLWWIISANLTNTGHNLLQKPHPSKIYLQFMFLWKLVYEDVKWNVLRLWIRTRESIVHKNIFWWVQNDFLKVVCVKGSDMRVRIRRFSRSTKSHHREEILIFVYTMKRERRSTKPIRFQFASKVIFTKVQ